MKKVARYSFTDLNGRVRRRLGVLMCIQTALGAGRRDRKSTSGGAWTVGKHTIETYSAAKGAYALSSAEAGLYVVIEGVTRAKGLITLAKELGAEEGSSVIQYGTDSSPTKSLFGDQRLVIAEGNVGWGVFGSGESSRSVEPS